MKEIPLTIRKSGDVDYRTQDGYYLIRIEWDISGCYDSCYSLSKRIGLDLETFISICENCGGMTSNRRDMFFLYKHQAIEAINQLNFTRNFLSY